MRDDAATILAAALIEAIEPPPKMSKLALLRTNPRRQQLVRRLAQARPEVASEDAGELISRSLAQREPQALEGIARHLRHAP